MVPGADEWQNHLFTNRFDERLVGHIAVEEEAAKAEYRKSRHNRIEISNGQILRWLQSFSPTASQPYRALQGNDLQEDQARLRGPVPPALHGARPRPFTGNSMCIASSTAL